MKRSRFVSSISSAVSDHSEPIFWRLCMQPLELGLVRPKCFGHCKKQSPPYQLRWTQQELTVADNWFRPRGCLPQMQPMPAPLLEVVFFCIISLSLSFRTLLSRCAGCLNCKMHQKTMSSMLNLAFRSSECLYLHRALLSSLLREWCWGDSGDFLS